MAEEVLEEVVAGPPEIRSSGTEGEAPIRAGAESSPVAACAGIEPSKPPSGAVGATIRAAMGVPTGGRHRRGGRRVDGVQRVQKSDLGRRSHTGSPEASEACLACRPSGSRAAAAASAARYPKEEVLLKAASAGSPAAAAESTPARP